MPSPTPENPAELELLDAALGVSLLRSEAAYRRVLPLFARTHESDGERLRDHVAAGQKGEAAALVHKVRGSAASLALPRLAFLAGELERALKSGDELGALPMAFDDALRATQAAILGYLGPAKPAPAERLPPLDEARARLCMETTDKLLLALEAADPDAAEPLVAKLGESLPEGDLRPIREAIEEFDFRTARSAVGALRERLAQRGSS